VPLSQSLKSRARSRVLGERSEDVELDTRVGRSVKLGSSSAAGQLGSSGSLNLEVDTLRVRLRAVGLASSMQGDDLVADDVVARSDVGESQVPSEVVGNQVVGGPLSRVAAGLQRLGLDLGPLQACRVDRTAVAVAGRDVFLDGADVAHWPGVPLERDLAAGLDGYVAAIALALLVADDCRGAEGIWGDEAVVEVVGLPANSLRDGGLVFQRSIPTLVGLAIGNDAVNVAMGCHEGREKNEEGEHGAKIDVVK